jgi:hypothetical protein
MTIPLVRSQELQATQLDLQRARNVVESEEVDYAAPFDRLVVHWLANVYGSFRDPRIMKDLSETHPEQTKYEQFVDTLITDCLVQAEEVLELDTSGLLTDLPAEVGPLAGLIVDERVQEAFHG